MTKTEKWFDLKVLIRHPETRELKELNFQAGFGTDPDGYGNGTRAFITKLEQGFDLRYDKSFHPGKEVEWLQDWAENYWNGKNGAWELQAAGVKEITK